MASEPSISREVGKRTSRVRIEVIRNLDPFAAKSVAHRSTRGLTCQRNIRCLCDRLRQKRRIGTSMAAMSGWPAFTSRLILAKYRDFFSSPLIYRAYFPDSPHIDAWQSVG